jgi:hypothetical protein
MRTGTGRTPILYVATPDWLLPVGVMFALLVLAYIGMWFGWRRRSVRHVLPPLHAVPSRSERVQPVLQADARYFGTTVGGDWLDRVVAHGLGARSGARLSLSEKGLDVLRPHGSFRVPVESLRGARHDQGIAGKVVWPHGLLVVTWQHGDRTLDTGFRLEPSRPESSCPESSRPDPTEVPGTITETHNEWISTIGSLVRERKEHTA